MKVRTLPPCAQQNVTSLWQRNGKKASPTFSRNLPNAQLSLESTPTTQCSEVALFLFLFLSLRSVCPFWCTGILCCSRLLLAKDDLPNLSTKASPFLCALGYANQFFQVGIWLYRGWHYFSVLVCHLHVSKGRQGCTIYEKDIIYDLSFFLFFLASVLRSVQEWFLAWPQRAETMCLIFTRIKEQPMYSLILKFGKGLFACLLFLERDSEQHTVFLEAALFMPAAAKVFCVSVCYWQGIPTKYECFLNISFFLYLCAVCQKEHRYFGFVIHKSSIKHSLSQSTVMTRVADDHRLQEIALKHGYKLDFKSERNAVHPTWELWPAHPQI